MNDKLFKIIKKFTPKKYLKLATVRLMLMITLSLLCTGCTNKILYELIFIVTDGVYIMESVEDELDYAPSISFDTKEKTFEFCYDSLSSYLNYGTYSIQNDEVIAITSDGKYTYTFKIIDDDTISFVADKSDATATVEGTIAVPDESIFVNPIFKPDVSE